jgi:beta-mannosidase
MKKESISRRDCLTLLGTGAAAMLGSKVSSASSQTTEKIPPPEQLQPGAGGSLPIVVSAWEELSTSARVYDTTPVQARSEYATGQRGEGSQINLDGDWELVEADETMPPGEFPATSAWIKVKMPSPVQYALMEAGKIPNLWYGDNFKRLQWIQQRDWYLRRRFTIPESWRGSTIRLRFDGMDYRGVVALDRELLGTHEGAFGGPTFDISAQAEPGEHELMVRLLHETHDPLPNYFGDSNNGKPRVVKPDAEDGESYQWGNRYRSMGLYQPIRLIATGPAYMESPFVRTDAIASGSATLWGQAMITNTGDEFAGIVDAQIVDLSNNKEVVWQGQTKQKVASGITFWERSIELKNPKLWWPNGLGDQPLYRLELKLRRDDKQLDAISSRFGVRTLELKRNAVSPDSPRKIAKGATLEDEAYQYLWVANGKPFYAKGACWMASDDVLALVPQREEWMLRAAKVNGLNILRLNGGTSIFETEQFYNLCDENGLIVWQEAPLNWDDSPGTSSIDVWKEQLTQCVLRFRQHPSTGIYVGGNEFDPFVDGIEPLLGLVREVFAGYDGTRPFRMNSPCGGDVHAYEPPNGLYTGDENWYHKIWDRGTCFISEWSFSSFANMSLLKRMIPATELAVKPVGYDVEKFKNRYPTIRDRSAELKYTFVKSWLKASWYGDLGKADMEQLVEYSQMGYAHNIACVFEQWRAQFPYTGGETLWTYNSLGPIAESWHLIDWCGQPQIPFYASQRANEPVHVMADTGFFNWGPGDTFRASVFALNDRDQVLKAARFTARILDQELKPAHDDSWEMDVPAGGYMSETHEISWPIPADMAEGYFFLELTLADGQGVRLSRRADWIRVVKVLADPAERKKWQSAPVEDVVAQSGPWLKPQLEKLPTSLEGSASFEQTSKIEGEITVAIHNAGSLPAYPVHIDLLPDVYSVVWTDNYFWLAPGEKVTVKGMVRLDMTGLDPFVKPAIAVRSNLSLQLSAWNAPPIKLRV